MPRKDFIDLTGLRFGKWLVLRQAPKLACNKNSRWLCRCECGHEHEAVGVDLRNGRSHGCRSCMSTKHGGSQSRLYSIWNNMHRRCSEPSNNRYQYYGAKGVVVCDEWADFAAFQMWSQANGYTDKGTIDRIDPNGDYEPGNCEWVSVSENTRRSNVARQMRKAGFVGVAYG